MTQQIDPVTPTEKQSELLHDALVNSFTDFQAPIRTTPAQSQHSELADELAALVGFEGWPEIGEFVSDNATDILAALRTPASASPADVEAIKVAFWASIMNANAGFKYLDYDSLDQIITRAWEGFEQPLIAALTQEPKT